MDSSKTWATLNPISDKCIYNKCDGTGLNHIKNLNTGEEFFQKCSCREDIKYATELQMNASIPEKFVHATINSFNTTSEYYKNDSESFTLARSAKLMTVNYVNHFEKFKNEGKGLYFYSATKGSGKTRLACSVANALYKQYGVSIHFTTTVDLLDNIRNTFDKDSSMSSEKLNKMYREVDVLILDDIGVEKVTEWVIERFTALLSARQDNRKITIFTSNLLINELNFKVFKSNNTQDQDHHTERILSRIENNVIKVGLPEVNIRNEEDEKIKDNLMDLLFETN